MKRLGALAGVMITASHNPKDDNGYKLYAANAVQIIAPVDTAIARAIEEPESLLIRDEVWDLSQLKQSPLCDANKTVELNQAYLDYVRTLADPMYVTFSSLPVLLRVVL